MIKTIYSVICSSPITQLLPASVTLIPHFNNLCEYTKGLKQQPFPTISVNSPNDVVCEK